jgi:eukaryotic-like serine/threonine-protein kinase
MGFPESSTSRCPDEDTLLSFVDGDGDPQTASHVRTCSRCQRALALCIRSASRATDPERSDDALIRWVEQQQERRASELRIGAKVERYGIVRRVGEGGMGVVYAAHDPELDRPVAIKVMHRTKSAPGEENRRMLREARALAKVSHPHVVAVYDVGMVEDRVFLVMELVEGTTLREWLLAPRDRDAILDAFIQAGRGLAAAHAAGLVHRDFKPENVLLGDDGRVRVTDFGLARAARPEPDDSRITVSAAVVGTPSYMAPEVQRGDDADARSDQFSFGVALYRAHAGHSPRPDLPLASDGNAVPRRLRRVLRRALSLDREARFSTMHELVSELEKCRRGRSERRLILALGIALMAIASGAAYGALRSPDTLDETGAAAAAAARDAPGETSALLPPPTVPTVESPVTTAETATATPAAPALPLGPKPPPAPASEPPAIPTPASETPTPPAADPLSEF